MAWPDRVPYQPLLDWAKAELRSPDPSMRDVARLFGVDAHAPKRWANNGIPIWNADRLACRMGLHPTEIWGQAFYVGI
jgi:hypothetical protein